MEPIVNLSWLHFADLNIRPEFMLQRHALGLLEEIGRLVDKYGPPDFIVTSGGLTAGGEPGEFAAARLFFDQALEATGLSSDRLFITPGESDAPQGRLEAFREFAAAFGQPSTPGEARMHCFAPGSLPVTLCSLEAAPLSGGLMGRFSPQATQALSLTLGQPREATLRFLLAYLSPQQIQTAGGDLALTPEACDFILYSRGSLQAPARVAQWGNCVMVQGGAQPGEALRPNAFNLARLNFATRIGELHFRRYDSAAGGWLPELSSAAQEGIYRFMLDDALRARLEDGPAEVETVVWPAPEPPFPIPPSPIPPSPPAPLPIPGEGGVDSFPVGAAAFFTAEGRSGVAPLPNEPALPSPPAPLPILGEGRRPPLKPLLGAELAGWGTVEGAIPPRLVSDLPGGQDCLGFAPEATAVAQLLVSRQTQGPLALGLFGGPGSGKTFFLQQVHEQVRRLADEAGMTVVQASFNPWLDSDADPWSALAAGLYQSLDEGATPRQRADLRRQAAATLQEVEQARQQAQAERDSAAFYLEHVDGQLQEARKQREQATAKQQELLSGLTLANLLPFGRHKELVVLAGKLGFPAVFETLEQLAAALESLQPPARRLRVALRTSAGQRLSLVLGLIALLLSSVLAYAAYQGLHRLGSLPEILSGAIAATFYLASILLAAVVWAWALLNQVQPWITQLTALQGEARRNYTQRRRSLAGREAQVQEETAQANEREQSARQALSAAQARLAQAEAALKQLDAAPEQTPLLEFARRRLAEEQAEQGEAAELHTDLKTLAALLRGGRTDGLPQVERIIVYVDDLERCSPARLETVLQALHLLLSFESFVVVIAADPAALQAGLRAGPSGGEEPDAPRRRLEKLVQIPFHLPRLAAGGAQAVASWALVGKLPAAPPSPPAPLPIPGEGGAGSLTAGDAAPFTAEGRGEVARTLGTPQPVNPPSAAALPSPPAPLSITGEGRKTPAALRAAGRARSVEAAFVGQVAGLLASPRLARRLVNLYSLLRAAAPPEQLERFLSDADGPGEYRAAAALLALQLAYPEPAAQLSAYLLALPPDTELVSLAARLAPRQVGAAAGQPGATSQSSASPHGAVQPKYANALQNGLSAGQALAWQGLLGALDGLLAQQAVPDRAGAWAAWVPLVGRLSFDGPPPPPAAGLGSDVRIAELLAAAGPRSPRKECVRLENRGAAPQLLLGWTLTAPGHKAVFNFPAVEMAPGATLDIWTGDGQDGETGLHWGRKSPAWSGAEELWLSDADGELVSRLPAPVQSSG